MSHQKGKKGESQKWLVGRGIFIGTSLTAVVLAVVLVTLGWSSGHKVISPPPTTKPPITTGTTKPPTGTTTSPATTTPVIVVSGTSIGSPRAPITIVEYSDFQCSNCQRFAITIGPLIDAAYIQTGKVRLIYRYIVAYGEESLVAAEAAECAAEQNLFWPYYLALMDIRLSSETEDLTVEKLQEIAQQVGLNMDLFNQSLNSGKFRVKVMNDDSEGRGLGLDRVPSFFINGVKADEKVAGSFEEFQKVLDAALAESGQ